MSDKSQSRNKEVTKNAWNTNKKMHVPKETVMHDKNSDEWVDISVGNDISDDNNGNEEIESNTQSDRNDRRGDNKKIKHRKKSKDREKFTFEIIDNIAQTMKKLDYIVIDYYSDSDKSEKLVETQKTRLYFLKK